MVAKMRQVVKVLPNIWRSRDLIGFFVVFAVLLILFVVGVGKVGLAFTAAETVKKDIVTKSKVVQEYEGNVSGLNGMLFRPVAQGELEVLSGVLFQRLQDYHLNLVSFGASPGAEGADKKIDGVMFELVYSGAWNDSVRFVEGFSLGNALVAVKNFKMEPDDKLGVKATLQYKIYVQ